MERERIRELGGVVVELDHVWRVNGFISVARAIGNYTFAIIYNILNLKIYETFTALLLMQKYLSSLI